VANVGVGAAPLPFIEDATLYRQNNNPISAIEASTSLVR
jgi:hypothetical protein